MVIVQKVPSSSGSREKLRKDEPREMQTDGTVCVQSTLIPLEQTRWLVPTAWKMATPLVPGRMTPKWGGQEAEDLLGGARLIQPSTYEG